MPNPLRFSNPKTLAPPPGYSYVVEATGPCRTVYLAGQLGVDMNNKFVGEPGDFRSQCIKAHDNMTLALEAAGASWSDVVKINNYLVDIERAIAIYREVRGRYLNAKAPPVSTTVACRPWRGPAGCSRSKRLPYCRSEKERQPANLPLRSARGRHGASESDLKILSRICNWQRRLGRSIAWFGVAGCYRHASVAVRCAWHSMQMRGLFPAIVAVLSLAGCGTVHNLPLNEPSSNPLEGVISRAAAAQSPSETQEALKEGNVIALSFSGGGTRAAAFSFGVLEQLGRMQSSRGRDLLDHVGMVSGVSGGAISASYFGLKGRAALADFREQFLTQDLMAQLRTDVSLVNIGRALGGGANTDDRLRDWLNARLYHGATFGDLIARGRPITLINATDIYSRTPFLFTPATFLALCSDLNKYPVAAGVAASAAVPGAFAPIVVEAFPDRCQSPLPPEIERAANDPTGSPLVHSFARSLQRVRTGGVKYVKLLDGGLVDNYGLSGITIALGLSGMPYGPLQPREALNMRRLLFLVVDSGRGPSGDWTNTVEGPTGKDLITAVVDATIDANTRSSYAAFEASMKNWREELVRWRCSLKPADVSRLRGHGGPWNCRDLKFIIGRVSFDQFDATRAKWLNAVPTSFTLPVDTVDELRRAGGDALQANPTFQAFLRDMR